MASGQTTVTIDFGAAPGSNEATIAVTGQTAISATSKADAFIMGDDSTVDHSALDHRYFDLFTSLTCGTPTAGSGYNIYAVSAEKLTGTYNVRTVWAD